MPYRLLILILCPLLSSLPTRAADNRPFWTEQALFHFGDDVFFTGRSPVPLRLKKGRQRAYLAAIQGQKFHPRQGNRRVSIGHANDFEDAVLRTVPRAL